MSSEIEVHGGRQLVIVPQYDTEEEWAGACFIVMAQAGRALRVRARVESWFERGKDSFRFVVHAPDLRTAEPWDGTDPQSRQNARDAQRRIEMLEMQLREARAAAADWEKKAHQVDALYVAAGAVEAEVRIALEAPNPCDIVRWAREVKKKAGAMDSDIFGQTGRSR